MASTPNESNSGVLDRGQSPPPPKPVAKKPRAKKVQKPVAHEEEVIPAELAVVPEDKPPVAKPVARRAPAKKGAAAKPPVKPAAAVPEGEEDEVDERATAASWQQMAMVYTVSMVLHAAVLVILGLIMLPQDVREEILSVIAKEEKPIEPPPMETLVEEPEILEEIALEDTPTDANALVDSEVEAEDNFNLDLSDDALSLKPLTTEGPSLPIKVGDISSGRSQASRAAMLAERGGNEASDKAVGYALDWLASVQRRDGSWDFDDAGKAGGAGNLSSPTGATGLALMAFLGAGHTHMKESKYKNNVERGLGFLMRSAIRSSDGLDYRGNKPGNEGMYVQAIVTTALAEAFGMTKDRRLLPFAQGASNFIVQAQHPSGGGWRYKPRQAGDTSVVGWQVMALKSAYHAKIPIPRTVGMGINKFLDEVGHERNSQYSYMRGQKPKASTTAIGLLCRMYMGWKQDNPALLNGVKYLAEKGPSKNDIYYDYYASQVMIQMTGARGELWDKWNTTMRDWLVATQIKTGPGKGSWDVIEKGHKGDRGGRLYTTCLAVMTLEIYYRVLPLYKSSAVESQF